jgi:signal transduction histidine kinase
MGRGLHLASGRVIALGRLLLAILFVGIVWAKADHVVAAPTRSSALLIAYGVFALLVAIATWRSWWLDARLAGPAHAIDIALFTALVYLTEGDNNPFSTFSVFILLSAAFRWGWRATTLTAILLALLFVLSAVLPSAAVPTLQFGDFASGAGQLLILSVILIWFGVNQWRSTLRGEAAELLAEPTADSLPLENGLRAAMASVRASRGAFVWSSKPRKAIALIAEGGTITEAKAAVVPNPAPSPFLYDLRQARALMRDREGNLREFDPAEHVRADNALALSLSDGLAVPVSTDRGHGQIFLEQVRGLSTDHLLVGAEVSAAVASYIQRRALMKAAEENAESRSRLAIARDLHDSVVQFLAGAAFRLEAMKRSQASGRELTPELDELKELMLQEQSELRSFITALRSGSQIELAELARDLQALANRLARQWHVQCSFSLEEKELMVPARLHLDAQQLVREAVANAVRHAGAKNVSIRLAGEEDAVTLDFINDGATYAKGPEGDRVPRSIKERVEAAGGGMEISRGMGVTRISVMLPLARQAA